MEKETEYLGLNAYPDDIRELFGDPYFTDYYINKYGIDAFDRDCDTPDDDQLRTEYEDFYKGCLGITNHQYIGLKEVMHDTFDEHNKIKMIVNELTLCNISRNDAAKKELLNNLYVNATSEFNNPQVLAAVVIYASNKGSVMDMLLPLVMKGHDIYGAQAAIRNEMLEIKSRAQDQRHVDGRLKILLSHEDADYYNILRAADGLCIRMRKFSPYEKLFTNQFNIEYAKSNPGTVLEHLTKDQLEISLEEAENMVETQMDLYDPDMLLRVATSYELVCNYGQKIEGNFNKKRGSLYPVMLTPEIKTCFYIERSVRERQGCQSNDTVVEPELKVYKPNDPTQDN